MGKSPVKPRDKSSLQAFSGPPIDQSSGLSFHPGGKDLRGFVQVRAVSQTPKPPTLPPGDGRMVKVVLNCHVSGSTSLLAELSEDGL